MKRSNLGGNIFSMVLWQLGNYAIPLLTFPYLTRTLGVRQFGVYALSFAIASYLVLITDWGFVLTAPGQIARAGGDKDKINGIFWSTLTAKFCLAVLTLSTLIIAVVLVPSVRSISPVLLCAAGMVVANVFTVNWLLQGLEKLGKFATAAMIGRGLTVPATFLLVHGSGDAWIAALIQAAGAMVAGAVSLALARNLKVIGSPIISVSAAFSQAKEAWPLFLSALSSNLYTSTNTVLLGVMRGPVETGIFGGADRLRMAAQATINPISQAVYPRSSRLMMEDKEKGLRLARQVLIFQGVFTFFISLVVLIFASPIIHILAGGKFDGSVAVLQLLAPIPFFVGIGNVLGVQLMLPLGLKSSFSRILVMAAVLDIAVAVPLSYRYGASGTAAAALLAEVFVACAMAVALLRAGVPIIGPLRVSART